MAIQKNISKGNKPKETKVSKTSKTKKSTVKVKTFLSVVGIGASAGGLEALEIFFKNLPANTGMAFVVIQHLDPDHKGLSARIASARYPDEGFTGNRSVKNKAKHRICNSSQ